MRGLLGAILICAAVPAASRADTKIGEVQASDEAAKEFWSWVAMPFVWPYIMTNEWLEHHGYGAYPYDGEEPYTRGGRPRGWELTSAVQVDRRGRRAYHEYARMRSAGRVGWEVGVTSFERGALTDERAGDFYHAHALMTWFQSEAAVLDVGMGGSILDSPARHPGMSGSVALEAFPIRPLNVALRYQLAFLGGPNTHELSGSLGFSWRWIGVSGGYRAFINPQRNTHGPEAAFRVWF